MGGGLGRFVARVAGRGPTVFVRAGAARLRECVEGQGSPSPCACGKVWTC